MDTRIKCARDASVWRLARVFPCKCNCLRHFWSVMKSNFLPFIKDCSHFENVDQHCYFLAENVPLSSSVWNARAQTTRTCTHTREPACRPVLLIFTSPHVKHPPLLLTAHQAQLSVALRLIYGRPSLPRWCNNRGGLLLPSYGGKVEKTLTQVSLSPLPRPRGQSK